MRATTGGSGSLFVLASILVTLAACDNGSSRAASSAFAQWANDTPGTLLTEDCGFEVPESLEAHCHRLVVLQDRTKPQGPHLTVAVAEIRIAGQSAKPDPVLYLEGGPGGESIPDWTGRSEDDEEMWRDFQPVFNTGRTLLLYDGRGIGRSQPHLDCQNAADFAWKAYYKPPDKRDDAAYVDRVKKCLTRWREGGVDFAAYNSRATAEDLAELRKALGIDKWNVYGVSYGARTALELAAFDPAGIRSVIYDSPSYQRENVWQDDQAAFDRVLALLNHGCQSGELCSPARDDILSVLERNLKSLEKEPRRVSLNYYSPKAYFDRELATWALHLLLYHRKGAYLFEGAVDSLRGGERDNLRYLLQLVHHDYEPSGFSDIVNWTTYCREQNMDGPYDLSARFAIYSSDDISDERQVCTMMGLTNDRRRPESDGGSGPPALVLSGNRDPITPPEYGAFLAADVAARAQFVFRDAAHGVAFRDDLPCAQRIVSEFWEQPDVRPDSSCMEE